MFFTKAKDSDTPYSRAYEGAGLGLPLVKRLVDLMGGNASIVSQEGQGTTVYVSLPFKIPESKQQELSINKTKEKSTFGRCLKVLLADDDELTQLQIQALLAKQNISTKVVDSGQKALKKLNEEGFDCILMDVQMPVLDGIAATKQIRSSLTKYKDIPIIALTAYAMTGDREKFLEAGMDDYISKPVDKDELWEVINRNLSE